MFGRARRPEPDVIEVIIGPQATFRGDLRSDSSIRIDGAVEGGRVQTPANVILTEAARVDCDIYAKTVSIRGIFRGIIHAERVELLRGSQVFGAVHVRSFYMDDGVLLRAEIDIQDAPGQSAPAPVPSASRAPLSTGEPNEPQAPRIGGGLADSARFGSETQHGSI